MTLSSAHKYNSNVIVENEVRHIRNIDAIMDLAVRYINDEIANIGYIEEDTDSDYTEFKESTIEFPFLDIRLWVDAMVQNDSCQIEWVDVKDNEDNDYTCLSLMIKQNLCNY